MQPSQILHAIRRNLVACLVILLVCTLAGLGVALSTKPVAVATTTLGIQPQSKDSPSFSTQAKELMPTVVELSTSPKVLEPAASSLKMKASDLSDALTVTNPPETLVLTITAKADSKQKATNMAQATAASLNKEISSGDLLGKEALGMTTSTTSPATPGNTTLERPGARAAAVSGLLLGLLASVSYAMLRHRRSAEPGVGHGEQDGSGRAMDTLRALGQKALTLLRPSPPPAQQQVPDSNQYQQLQAHTQPQPPVTTSPETSFSQTAGHAQTPGAIASQPASAPVPALKPSPQRPSASSLPSPASAPAVSGSSSASVPASQPTAASAAAPAFVTQQVPEQTTAMPVVSAPLRSPAPAHDQAPATAPQPTPFSVPSAGSTTSMTSTPSASAASAATHSSPSRDIMPAPYQQQAREHVPDASGGTGSPVQAQSYTHAPLAPPLPVPEDLTVPASPSIAVQQYTSAPASGSHRSPGPPDAPARRSTALPTGQTVTASSASPAGALSYQHPPTSAASTTPVPGRRRVSAPASTSAPGVPTRRRIVSPSTDRQPSPTEWQDAASLPTTTSRRRTRTPLPPPETDAAAQSTQASPRGQEPGPDSGSGTRPLSARQQMPSRRQVQARRRRTSKPRLTLVAPLTEEPAAETRHLTPVQVSVSGRHRSPDPPDAPPPPPPPPSIHPGRRTASAVSPESLTSAVSMTSVRRGAQPPRRSW